MHVDSVARGPSTLAASKSNVPKCNNWYYRSLITILYSDPEGGGNVTWSMRCNFDQTKSHRMRSTYVCGARTRHLKKKRYHGRTLAIDLNET